MFDGMNDFQTIATLPAGALKYWSYDDLSAAVNQRDYRYRIISVDKCGNIDTSNVAHSILLKVVQEAYNINRLIWNPYSGWITGTDYYRVLRFANGQPLGLPVTLPASSGGSLIFEDDVTNFVDVAGRFCYVVLAVELPGNTISGAVDTSYSNRACVERSPDIYVPSAFRPASDIEQNRTFKPQIPFLYGSDYYMAVFNRWGEKIFETRDINRGWDGSFQGKEAPQGVYIYLIQLKDNSGEKVVKRGTLTLLR